MNADVSSSSASWHKAALGLLLTPLVVGVASVLLPRVHLGDSAASAVVFFGAAATTLSALAIAAGSFPPWKWRLSTVALATLVLAAAWAGVMTARIAPVAVSAALVAAAWAIGTSIGRRIEHPGHLLPACVVVACADATSVFSELGPTRAIAESEAALSMATVGFPVPGTSSFAPALGIGDLVFVALVFGAALAHRLSLARTAFACAVGTTVAGVASALLETAVPALVPIAAAVVLGLPEARRVRPRDQRVANFAMAVAVSVAAAAIASQLFATSRG